QDRFVRRNDLYALEVALIKGRNALRGGPPVGFEDNGRTGATMPVTAASGTTPATTTPATTTPAATTPAATVAPAGGTAPPAAASPGAVVAGGGDAATAVGPADTTRPGTEPGRGDPGKPKRGKART